MTGISLVCPIEPWEMAKPMKRGFEDILRRIVVSSAAHGFGNDMLLRIYIAGIYHGVELGKRSQEATDAAA